MNNKTTAPVINPDDRPAEVDELNFDDDQPTPNLEDPRSTQGYDPSARNAGLTEASNPGQGPTNDDLTPETLILEDGARSSYEREQGNLTPTDKTLSVVNENEIGGGDGLDEAELANVDPVSKQKTPNKK